MGIELLINSTKSHVFTVLPTANQMNWSQMELSRSNSQCSVLAKGCCKTPILQIRWVDQKFPGKRWLDGCVELPALNRQLAKARSAPVAPGASGLVEQYCPPSTRQYRLVVVGAQNCWSLFGNWKVAGITP